MNLTLHKQFPLELKDEWNRLLAETETHVPFLRFEYLELWWQTRGGGEWPQAELAIVTAESDGRLVAAAPLFYTAEGRGAPSLMLVGSVEISDYLDILAAPDALEPFLKLLLPFLKDAGVSPDNQPPWQRLDLFNLLDSSPTLKALEAAAQADGWTTQVEQLQHSPYIPLPGDWDTYLSSVDKKQRHEIRRKMRRVREMELPVDWYLVQDASKLEEEVNDFMALMRMDADKAAFLTPPMEEHMQHTARCAMDAGCLHLAFMTVDGKKAAGYFCFDYLNRIWVYNSGIDWENYSAYSPGWVLLGYMLQWANENQREAFDFMRGDEDYKYRFGAVDRFVMRAIIERN